MLISYTIASSRFYVMLLADRACRSAVSIVASLSLLLVLFLSSRDRLGGRFNSNEHKAQFVDVQLFSDAPLAFGRSLGEAVVAVSLWTPSPIAQLYVCAASRRPIKLALMQQCAIEMPAQILRVPGGRVVFVAATR